MSCLCAPRSDQSVMMRTFKQCWDFWFRHYNKKTIKQPEASTEKKISVVTVRSRFSEVLSRKSWWNISWASDVFMSWVPLTKYSSPKMSSHMEETSPSSNSSYEHQNKTWTSPEHQSSLSPPSPPSSPLVFFFSISLSLWQNNFKMNSQDQVTAP